MQIRGKLYNCGYLSKTNKKGARKEKKKNRFPYVYFQFSKAFQDPKFK